MLASSRSLTARHWRARIASLAAALTVCSALFMLTGSSARATLVGAGSASASAARASAARTASARTGPRLKMKVVRYRGYAFRVPQSWPVIDDALHPRGCVRFDQHAIYLGAVSSDQFCPSWLLGTTEALLVEPGSATVVPASTENPVARQITVSAPGIVVTATFDTDPTMIYRILASAALPAPMIVAANPARPAVASSSELATTARLTGQAARLRTPMPVPALPAAVASYHGLGFDACTAPSPAYMRAWLHHSPYRAVGIYVGGADRACAQANLTAGWVRREAQAGWHFIPLYAGPQAAFGQLSAPQSQGSAAANDAVAQAQRLGFGPRTPIYYDMEAYSPGSRISALRFLSAWTTGLHRLGYSSGVYSSSDSGVADLSAQYFTGRYAIPDVIYDALWNGSATTFDSNIKADHWVHHHRIHQYSGNVTQTFGGDTINIDKDFLNVDISTPGGTAASTSAVSLPNGSQDVFYQADGHELWIERFVPSSGWTKPVRTGASAWSVPSVVWTGSAVDVFYKSSQGFLRFDSYQPDGTLIARRRLPLMGILGTGPRAVAQPGGVIDVFWRGSADDHLWHGQFTPGSGWDGPQGLGGDLASAPSPVESAPGTTAVFWKGTDGSLWQVTRNLHGRWSAPASLGMGPLGGPPQATAQPSGAIEVYWPGTGIAHLWEGFYQPSAGWRGPRDLGGRVRSAPAPVTAGRTVRVLWRGLAHQLDYVRHRQGSGWNVIGWDGPVTLHLGWLNSGPFAAVGGPGGIVQVFWRGRDESLWTASLTGHGWSGPVRLAA